MQATADHLPSRRVAPCLRWRVALVLILAITSGSTSAATEDPGTQASEADTTARSAEVAAAITRDQRRLKVLLSEPRAQRPLALHDDPELRAIAERLPRLQQEQRRLADAQRKLAPPPRNERSP